MFKGDKLMSHYLLEVKAKVDAITAAGSTIDPEDVILYTLNGLPSSYQSFKTAIRTNLQPLNLDDFYSLLCSEEQNILQDASQDLQALNLTDKTLALTVSRGRGCGRSNPNRGTRGRRSPQQPGRGDRSSNRNVTCQICNKYGHSAIRCWYCTDPAYTESSQTPALFSPSKNPRQNDWFLDSGASVHLTADATTLNNSEPYTGSSQVTLGNGRQLPIQNTGNGILPTPSGTLFLHKIHHVLNLAFNLIYVHKLARDNNCIISFSPYAYQIKDLTTKRLLLQGTCHNDLYSIPHNHSTSKLALLYVQAIPNLWHH
ncbi:Retrovirus-related Pol polyprotein from transposon TNT 1-94 [Dendrobium catenatum]|uniref:Retrovirus-related Pol polyprotein from transposon TNT 1-94 n=1 Tax=Dendrobium catenatum TaxID=906689 RepID=A0A2I0VBC9_9ASPA|nr:Retrovirus-related Pol polyprotein from transposon TNT 1-94 [Dendrobium catenatum]